MTPCRDCGAEAWPAFLKFKIHRCKPCHRKAVNGYNDRNRDALRARARRSALKYYFAHKEEHDLRRRLRLQHYKAGTVTSEDLRQIWWGAWGRCCECGTFVEAKLKKSNPVGFDHVVPLFLGGKHEKSNLVVCCKQCNAVRWGRHALLASELRESRSIAEDRAAEAI